MVLAQFSLGKKDLNCLNLKCPPPHPPNVWGGEAAEKRKIEKPPPVDVVRFFKFSMPGEYAWKKVDICVSVVEPEPETEPDPEPEPEPETAGTGNGTGNGTGTTTFSAEYRRHTAVGNKKDFFFWRWQL